jgi:5S rRNA maturation endonuclease (ribonuclease M5)
MIDKREKRYQVFGEFVRRFVLDLNHLADEGWSVLVEGQRDQTALRKLGFTGDVVKLSGVVKDGAPLLNRKVVILTDLDKEGAVLAARYTRRLSHDGYRTSLKERLRLKNASHGMFLHVENLSRFAQDID